MQGGHNQHICSVLQPAERIGCHQLPVQRDVCAHLAVVFEIDPSRVENADRLLHALSALAERSTTHSRVLAHFQAAMAISSILHPTMQSRQTAAVSGSTETLAISVG